MYETRRRTPDASVVRQLADALEVSVPQLDEPLTPIPEKFETPAPGQLTLSVSQFEARVLLAMRMNVEVRDFLHAYVTGPAEQRARLQRTWDLIQSFQPPVDSSPDDEPAMN